MAANVIQDILGYTYLGGLIKAVKTGIPEVLPEPFMRIGRKVVGDSIVYTRVTGQRKVARRVERNAPSVKRELSPVGDFPVKMPTFKEHVDIDVDTFQRLRAYDQYALDTARREVGRQAAEFRALFDNNRIAMPLSVLANGKIWFDADGNILPSSSGATLTIDYGMNANNQNQLNSIIGASWATATTDIPGDLRAIRKTARQLTGYPIRYAFYGENIPGYISTNNYVKDWVVRHPRFNPAELESLGMELPSGLLGLEWIPVYESFFVDSGGTTREFFGPDAIIFTPAPDDSWWEYAEGSYPVPKTFGPTSTLESILNTTDQEFGMASYAVLSIDPPTARLHYQDVALPMLKNPDVIFQADVTP